MQDTLEGGLAGRLRQILKIAKTRSMGVHIYNAYGVDLLEAVNLDSRLRKEFIYHAKQDIQRIDERRVRQALHYEKFGKLANLS